VRLRKIFGWSPISEFVGKCRKADVDEEGVEISINVN
jgi:hypothetical protein